MKAPTVVPNSPRRHGHVRNESVRMPSQPQTATPTRSTIHLPTQTQHRLAAAFQFRRQQLAPKNTVLMLLLLNSVTLKHATAVARTLLKPPRRCDHGRSQSLSTADRLPLTTVAPLPINEDCCLDRLWQTASEQRNKSSSGYTQI